MNKLIMPSGHSFMGWSTTVDGVSAGTSFGRDGPVGFDGCVKTWPSSHIVESLVFAPLLNKGSDDAYYDFGKSIKVKTKESKGWRNGF